jgi:hypothetical protein
VHTTVASFTQLSSGNWRVQVRRKNRYVAETFRRRKDGEEWALDMECNIDRSGSPKPRAAVRAKTFGDIIDLHVEDMHEVPTSRLIASEVCPPGALPRRTNPARAIASDKMAAGSLRAAVPNPEATSGSEADVA